MELLVLVSSCAEVPFLLKALLDGFGALAIQVKGSRHSPATYQSRNGRYQNIGLRGSSAGAVAPQFAWVSTRYLWWHSQLTDPRPAEGRTASLRFQHPPIELCMRFARTQLTDGLLSMVTQPPRHP